MALQAGSVYTDAGVRVDDGSFTRLRRRMDAARSDARHPIEGEAKLDVDERGFRKLKREQDDAERHSSRFRTGVVGSFGALRVGVAGAAAAGGAAVGAMALKIVGSASDINESLSKNQVLFGDHAKEVERFSETSAKSYGIARGAALEYTGTFGNLFRALGISRQESAKTSVELTKLAADMASFNNTSPEEALEALRSGLVGETEPLRAFGVNINDAQLRQEALKQGLVKTTKEALDPQARAMAAVALVTKQTANAHGDFARTSGGLANQSRILKARLSDVGSELGAKLLPLALKVVSGTNKLVDGFGSIGGVTRRVQGWFSDVVGAFRGGDEGATRFGGRVREVFGFVRDFLVDVWRRVSRVFKGSGDDFRALGQGFVAVANRIADVMVPIYRRVLPPVAEAIGGLAKVVRGVVRIVAGLLTGDWSRAWKGAKDVVGGVFTALKGIVKAGIGLVLGELEGLLGGLGGILNKIIDVINKLPGVNIGHVRVPVVGSGAGRAPSSAVIDHRTRGYAAGGIVDAPTFVVGEEAPQHPEVIIPSNPAYRGRALELWQVAGRYLGVPGFALGGVVGKAAGGLAGLVGSGAKWVGRSAGALAGKLVDLLPENPIGQPFTGVGDFLLDQAGDFIRSKAKAAFDALTGPFRSSGGGGGVNFSARGLIPRVLRALAFARSHGWTGTVTSGYRSDAEQLAIWNAGIRPAAKPRALGGPGSNHSGGAAVDVSDVPGFARAMAMMPAGQRLYARVPSDPIHFSVTGFRKGGVRGKKHPPKPILSKADTRGIDRSLARGSRGVASFEGKIQDLERRYGQKDREFGLSDEDLLVEHDDGSVTVDQGAVNARLGELGALRKIRAQIARTIKRYRERVIALIEKYRAAIKDLENAMRAAKGKARKKERAGYREAIRGYRERVGELKGVGHDLGFDAEDARIDLEELDLEIGVVRGTTGSPAPADDTGGDLGDGGAGDGSSSSDDPDATAIAAQATARAEGLAKDLAAVRSNFAAFTGAGDLGSSQGSSAYGSVLMDAVGGAGAALAAGLDPSSLGYGPVVVVNTQSFVTPTGKALQDLGDGVVDALRSRPARPPVRSTVGG